MKELKRRSGAYRILVVDDDPVHRDVLTDYLGLGGYTVLTAENGAEALALVTDFEPDLVLLDVQMPVLDGFQTLQQLKQDPAQRDLPVLFLSAADRSYLKVRGLELGAEDYITKPFDRAELLARVRAGLRRAARYRHLEGSMVGDITEVGLDSLLQTFHLGMRAAKICLVDMDAEIELRQGTLVYCRFRNFEGEQALTRVMLLQHGRFTVEFVGADAPSPDSRIPSIDSVLVDTLVVLDEAKFALSHDISTLVVLERRGEVPSLDKLRGAFPMRIRELIAAMPGELRENVKLIGKALASGVLRPDDSGPC